MWRRVIWIIVSILGDVFEPSDIADMRKGSSWNGAKNLLESYRL